MAEQSLKSQAEEIIEAVDQDLQAVESQPPDVQQEISTKTNTIMDTIFRAVSDVDLDTSIQRVKDLKAQNPDDSIEELSKKLIFNKCQKTGTVGAVTSGAGLIPGVGSAAAVTLGAAADIGATFKLQAELVLDLAALYDYPLTLDEKQRLVMFITGVSAGTTALTRKAGQAASIRIGERLAAKSVIKVLPIIGVVAAAGTNVLSTYIIGQRADVYFRLGPEAVGSWADSLRAISGVDERNIARWMAQSGRNTGEAIKFGAGKVSDAGKVAGGAVATGAGKIAAGIKKVALAIFAFIRKILRLIWFIITFIPRKIIGLFKSKPAKE